MALKKWRGMDATLSVTDQDGTTDIPVGVLQEVEVTLTREVQQMRGTGSVKWQDLSQTEIQIETSGEVLSWDATAFDKLVDYDSTNDEITDSSDVPTFTLTAKIKTAASTSTNEESKSLEVSDVYFEDMPVGSGKDDFIGLTLEGTGKDLKIINTGI